MRILILTHNDNRHFYFCNKLIEQTGSVVGIIAGAKKLNRPFLESISSRLKARAAPSTFRNSILNTVFKRSGRRLTREKAEAENEYFRGEADDFRRKHSQLLLAKVGENHRSVNSNYYQNIIRNARPDLIAVMGTCLIGKGIINSCRYVFNLHTGLSPYYRGGYTNLWPFLEGDYGYFGVTVHRMDLGIDSGDIIYTAQPSILPGDNFGRINCRSIILGTKLMAQAIKDAEQGRLQTIRQWERGKLFLNRDMNNYVAHKYFRIRDTFIATHLELEARAGLPKPRLISPR